MQVCIDHHRGRMIAMPETDDRQEREAVVRRRTAGANREPPLEVLEQRLAPGDPAGDAVAEQDHMAPDGAAEDEVVERCDPVELLARHAEQVGELREPLVGDPAVPALHELQRLDAGGAALLVASGELHERCPLLRLEARGGCVRHGARLRLAHRSTSAMTKSMLPMIAMRSAINTPRARNGIIC